MNPIVISVSYDRVWDTHTLDVLYSDGSRKIISVDEGEPEGSELSIVHKEVI